MKRIFLTMMAVCIIVLLIIPPNTQAHPLEIVTYKDVPKSHWAADEIIRGSQKGYVDGLPDGTFAPDANVKRSEFIKMIVAALELPIEEQQQSETWYIPYINTAQINGLIEQNEYENENYSDFMTRLEMVRVAVRALGDITDTENGGSDEEFMLIATQKGLIKGINGKLVPDGLTTRAQAVTVVERMIALLNGDTLAIDEEAVEVADIEYKMAIGDIWEEAFGVRVNSLEVARYIEMQIHESFKVENGHLKGFLPELPDGLEYGLSFYVEYDPKDKVTASNVKYLNYDVDLVPGESFSLPILQEDKVQRMLLHVGVTVTENGSKRRYSNMDFYNDREIKEYVKY